jgi:alkylation response protein AidB-like acyl-CoA dehydrogenase
MDFSRITLPADDVAFWRNEVVPFYDEHLDEKVLDRERREGNGWVPELEVDLGTQGWLEPIAPRSEGGADLDPVRAALVLGEEARRAGVLFPVKGSHQLVMEVVRRFGSPEVQAEVLAGSAAGTIKCCLGYTEPDCGSDAAAVTTRAVQDGSDWIVNGQKMFSTGAHLCQYAMITARTNPDAPKHTGITLFLAKLDQSGVERQGIDTLGGERTNFIYFDEAVIPDSHRLGPINQGWQVASGALAAEHGMDAAHGGFERTKTADPEVLAALGGGGGGWNGVLQVALDAAVAWARTATLDDGTRVIDDPVVRARLARIVVDNAVIDVTPSPFGRVISSDLLIKGAADLIDLCGPAGLLGDNEPASAGHGAIEWAHRFAQGTSIYGGTTDIQRNLIAEHFMGLPRHRGVIRT